jgi:hypothetical protein
MRIHRGGFNRAIGSSGLKRKMALNDKSLAHNNKTF